MKGLLDYDEDKDYDESVAAYLVVCGVIGQNVGLFSFRNAQRARFVSIPDSVEELCHECFCECKSLSRVTFGESSSLKLIWNEAFREVAFARVIFRTVFGGS